MIRQAARGFPAPVPEWASIMYAAREWGVPPWEVEEKCSQFWWERRRDWNNALSDLENGKP